jgi:hypothetical protein
MKYSAGVNDNTYLKVQDRQEKKRGKRAREGHLAVLEAQ